MKRWVMFFAIAVLTFAAKAEERPYAASTIPGKKWQDAQFKIVKPQGGHDLPKVLAQAKQEEKFVFVQVGRENCTNTMQLWHMLADGRVTLPKNFLYADISGDDEEMRSAFDERFTIDDDGFWFPYVVLVGPDGTQLASCSGRHTPEEYNAMLKKAVNDYTNYPAPKSSAP